MKDSSKLKRLGSSLSRDFPCLFTHHNFANQLRDKINEAFYCNRILRGSPEGPSGVATWVQLVRRVAQEPSVRGSNPSGARVQSNEGCADPRSGVQTPTRGWGPTCPIRVHLGRRYREPAQQRGLHLVVRLKNHPTLTGQDTQGCASLAHLVSCQ